MLIRSHDPRCADIFRSGETRDGDSGGFHPLALQVSSTLSRDNLGEKFLLHDGSFAQKYHGNYSAIRSSP
jgi:hypothetical protein